MYQNIRLKQSYVQLIVFMITIDIMNIRDLKYLVAVAELKNFSRAAEQCFTSQPTLSNQIKKLEDELDVQIFERTNKKVLVTEIGEKIIASARQILEQAEHIKELAQHSKDPLSGNFRLGAFPTLSTYIFPQIVQKIKKALPKIKLILVEEKTATLLEQLKAGELDAAFIALPVDDDYLESVPLFEDEFFLATAKDHPLAKEKEISHKDLAGYKLLLLEEGHCLRDHALQVCHLSGLEEDDVRATGLETLRQMVKAGTGITFMPKIAIQKGERGITYIPFKAPAPTREIGLVYRKTSARLGLMQKLRELI